MMLYAIGLKLKLLCGPHEDLQGSPRAALWCWRNNSGTSTYAYILFPAKVIMNDGSFLPSLRSH